MANATPHDQDAALERELAGLRADYEKLREEKVRAEQTLSQAEKDAEEQRMANDVTQPFTTTSTSLTKQEEKQTAAVQAPKTEPKSVPGLLYAIKGLASSISRKITGK